MVTFELVTPTDEDHVATLVSVEFSEKEWRLVTRWLNEHEHADPEVLAELPARVVLRELSRTLMWMLDYVQGTDRRQPRAVAAGPDTSPDRHAYTGGMPPTQAVLNAAQRLAALVCYLAQHSQATVVAAVTRW